MIFITGDCHREFHKFNKENFPEQKEKVKVVDGLAGGTPTYFVLLYYI